MNLFKRRKPPSAPGLGGAADAPADDPEIPRYPPFLKGLPVAAPARIVATQAELIARLQDGLAFTDARFAALVRNATAVPPFAGRYGASWSF
jgi:conjugal transfer pilus assembly protein TraI